MEKSYEMQQKIHHFEQKNVVIWYDNISIVIREKFDPIVPCTNAKNAQISKYVLASCM